MNGERKIKSQVTLELTLSLIVILLLLAGMFRVFLWSGRCIVQRERVYLSDFRNQFDRPTNFYQPDKIDLVPDIVR